MWHRESSKQKSIDAILQCVLEELPPEMTPKPENYFYKKHSEHQGFKLPPELQAVVDSQKAREAKAAAAAAPSTEPQGEGPAIVEVPASGEL